MSSDEEELKKVFSLKQRNPPWGALNWWGGWQVESWVTQLILRLQGLWQYLCTKTVRHRDRSFFLGGVWALIKATGRTLNQLSHVSEFPTQMPLNNVISLPTFSEDWGLQEQCKWYSIPRAFDTPWVIVVLKMEPLSLWDLEFKTPLISWEVSTVRFCLLISLGALGLGKCREPAWEIPPMTRSCGRDLMSKADQDLRDPLDLLEHLPPNQNLSYYFVPFTNSSDINRGLSPTTFLWKKST